MAAEIDLSNLTASEYESILAVLKRDHELRTTEEARIKPLKQELAYLKKRSALRQGVNLDRSCARCLSELGRFLNRGATCSLCQKKVCKSCRCYSEDNITDNQEAWICVFCHKQTLLKATSGEWMLEFSREPVNRRRKPLLGTQLEKAIMTETQKKEFPSEPNLYEPQPHQSPSLRSISPRSSPQVFKTRSSPDTHTKTQGNMFKAQQSPILQQSKENISPKHSPKFVYKSCSASEQRASVESVFNETSKAKEFISHSLELSRGSLTADSCDFDRTMPSPWNGIEAEPTIPMRSFRAASFGHLMSTDSDSWMHRDWHSSDDGRSTNSAHSSITEAADENYSYGCGPLAPMKPPRKKLSPLCKQHAVLDAASLDRQNSSVDSGVFSPEMKSEDTFEKPCMPSPSALSKNKDSIDSCVVVGSYSLSSSESESSQEVVESELKSGKMALRKILKSYRFGRDKEETSNESGNSLRSSPHGRMRMRHRTLSGGSDDGRTKKDSVPHISISECVQSLPEGAVSPTSVDSDNFVSREEDIDQVFSYHSRSQMSLSSFGGRSESVTSVYSAAGGGRYGTVIVTGEVLFSLCYNYKASVFEVLIKECRNLAPVDTKRNRSDPYVKIYLLPDRTKSGKRKTKVKKHTLNPVFDEPLKFQVTISEVERRTLWLSVWHSDRFGRNDFLGEVTLPLAHDSFENPELKWYPLQERMDTLDSPVSYKGDIILALKYVPFDVTSHKPRKKANNQTKGSLHVLVKEARNLMATRSNGTSDPFCKSYLLPDKSKSGKQKTPVLRKSCNPKWNHTFVYDDVTLDDLREKCLELTIWDYDKITSNDFLGGVRLCLGSGKHVGRDVDWMDSVGEEVSLWHTMIDRPNMWVDGSLLLRPSMQNRRIA